MDTKEEQKTKPFRGINHGTNKINLNHLDALNPVQYKPTEIHLKEDATIDNGPGFAIVMYNPYFNNIVGQISLKMFNDGLADIGYKIVKI